MLEWLTFVVAAVAAAGAVIGPIAAYRSAGNAMRREDERMRRESRQERVDVAVQYALSDNPVIAEMGVKQLLYLLQAGELSDDQKVAVSNALAASLELTADALEDTPQARAVTAGETTTGAAAGVPWGQVDAGEDTSRASPGAAEAEGTS